MPLQKVNPHSRLVLASDGVMVLREGEAGTNMELVLKAPTILQSDGHPSRLARVRVEVISKLETQPETLATNAVGRLFPTDKGASAAPSRAAMTDVGASALLYDVVGGGRVESVQALFPADLDVIIRLQGLDGVQETAVTATAVQEFSYTIENPRVYPIVPGSVRITYTVAAGARNAYDLWGDGRLIGRDCVGTINYATGEIEMKFAQAIDAVDVTVDFETPNNVLLFADSVIDVDANYTKRVQSLGAA